MIELALLFAAFGITNRVAGRFRRLSLIWGLHAVALAAILAAVGRDLLRVVLSAQHGISLDAPSWHFDVPVWLWLVPSFLGTIVSVLLISAILFLLSRRFGLPLVRWAGQPVWPERYWLHVGIAGIYTLGWLLASAASQTGGAYAALAALIVWPYIGRLTWLERRRRAAVARRKEDPRPPVLLLRSFEAARQNPDRGRRKTRGWRGLVSFIVRPSFEERLSDALEEQVGPLLILGDPAEFLPELGGTRYYVPGSAWQETVASAMAQAQCVLAMEGSSPGIRWEWEFILRNVAPQKVLLLTYPNGARRRSEWHDTAAMLAEIGIRVPSADPGGMSLYRFRDGWEGDLLLAGGRSEDQVAQIVARAFPLEREHRVLPGRSSLYARRFSAAQPALELAVPQAEALPQDLRSLVGRKPLVWIAASVTGVFLTTVVAFAIAVRLLAWPLATADDATLQLHGALGSDDRVAASDAVRGGADVNLVIGGRPILLYAIRKGDLDAVRFLLDNGADVAARSSAEYLGGRSVLHESALYGYYEITKLLIERGADVNARNVRGETPLFYAEGGLLAGPPRTPAHDSIAALLRQHGGVK